MNATVQHTSFNQDGSCFAVGTSSGFHVFNVEPFLRRYSCTKFGVSLVEMLGASSLLVLVGHRQNAALFSPRHLRLWDCTASTILYELSFASAVVAIKVNKLRLVVCCKTKIHIFSLETEKLTQLETLACFPSSIGNLCSLSALIPRELDHSSHSTTLPPNPNPYPTHDSCFLTFQTTVPGQVAFYDASRLKMINVFRTFSRGKLSAIALNSSASLLAVASEDGTKIKVFAVPGADCICTLQRGLRSAHVHGLSFAVSPPHSRLFCLSSATGSVHIFRAMDSSGKVPGRGGGRKGREASVDKRRYDCSTTNAAGNSKSDTGGKGNKDNKTNGSHNTSGVKISTTDGKSERMVNRIKEETSAFLEQDASIEETKGVTKTDAEEIVTTNSLPWEDDETFEIVDGCLSATSTYGMPALSVPMRINGYGGARNVRSYGAYVGSVGGLVAKHAAGLARDANVKAAVLGEPMLATVSAAQQAVVPAIRSLALGPPRAFAIARLSDGFMCGAAKVKYTKQRGKGTVSGSDSDSGSNTGSNTMMSKFNDVSTVVAEMVDTVTGAAGELVHVKDRNGKQAAAAERLKKSQHGCCMLVENPFGSAKLVVVTYDSFFLHFAIDCNKGGRAILKCENPLFPAGIK